MWADVVCARTTGNRRVRHAAADFDRAAILGGCADHGVLEATAPGVDTSRCLPSTYLSMTVLTLIMRMSRVILVY